MNMSISDVTMKLNMDRYLLLALEEDITSEDVSANAVMNRPCLGEVELICKQSGVLAGLQVFSRVFELLDERFTMESFCADGDRVEPGQRLALLRGDIRALLSGERTALNFLQRMSGIATHTAELVSLLQGSGITLLDTRKTTPNLRIFEKYAVTVGGGTNHRYNPVSYTHLRRISSTSSMPAVQNFSSSTLMLSCPSFSAFIQTACCPLQKQNRIFLLREAHAQRLRLHVVSSRSTLHSAAAAAPQPARHFQTPPVQNPDTAG